MARMTEEEAWALDELVTKTDITPGPNGSDWLSRREARLFGLDDITRTWLSVKAKADNKSPAQIINEIVHEKIAVASARTIRFLTLLKGGFFMKHKDPLSWRRLSPKKCPLPPTAGKGRRML